MKRWLLGLFVGALALSAGCTNPAMLRKQLVDTRAQLDEAQKVYARLCAPAPLADAESDLAFARLELLQGDMARANAHLKSAEIDARNAYQQAYACGTADRDEDKVPDIVDDCDDEKEDYDGVDDDDGCRDLDPRGDEDLDGVVNIDDACVDTPEDIDGDNDEDGCPEVSNDGDGDGLIDATDPCPDAAEDLDGFEDEDGCPEPDNDDDGINDLVDSCSLVAEDLDGWDDEDGCPDPDNDGDGLPDETDECPNEPGERERQGCPEYDQDDDGIADDNDQCPDQPEARNGYLDDDGCPDTPPKRVKVTRTRVELDEMVQFRTGSADLSAPSLPILDDVVKVLQDAPTMVLKIEGHTDNQGGELANLDLSQARAESVRRYIVSKGVAPDRITAQGFGETKPIDTNRTPEGRARNRRVEFLIVVTNEELVDDR